MKPKTTWILIADGARARVLEHKGPASGLSEVAGLEFAQTHLKSQDIMADKPGRSFSSVGHGRSAIQPRTDPVDKREADFVHGIAHVLEEKRRAGAFDQLIVVAAPQALGDLRKALPAQLQAVVASELAKDLTRVPNPDIARHLEGILAV